ncbi:MAG TPA: hypothetical protein VGM90_25325 [Kofleriaceae bacterium]
MRVAAAALLILVACGDNAEPPISATPRSGSRLRLLDESWDDLTRLRSDALYDADRNETCEPTEWSDGRRYCSPSASTAIGFSDAACTHPVALWSTLSPFPVPAYFRQQFFAAGSPTTSRLYQRGDRTDAPGEVYARLPGGCMLQPGPTDTQAYAVTELTAETFQHVALLPVDSDAHERIVRYAYASEDGMQLLVLDSRFDAQLGESCAWTALPGELQSTCAPATTDLTYYMDSRCTTPIVDVTNGIPAGLFRYFDPGTSCPLYGSIGTPVTLPSLYNRRFDGQCLLSVSTPMTNAAAVVPVQVATVQRNHIDEHHRLQRIERSERADKVTESRLYDTTLETECARMTLPDGDACVPISSPVNSPADATFLDENCTQRVDLDLVSAPLCADPPKFFVSLDVRGVPVVRPLIPYFQNVYRTSTSEECQLFSPSAAIYRLMDPLPSSMLARVTDAPR